MPEKLVAADKKTVDGQPVAVLGCDRNSGASPDKSVTGLEWIDNTPELLF